MAAPGVAEARLTMTAPLCAAVVAMAGATAVGIGPGLEPPPLHPHNKALERRIAPSIDPPARILNSPIWGQSKPGLRRRNHQSTVGRLRQTRAGCKGGVYPLGVGGRGV